MAKIKKTHKPSVGKNVKQLELSYIALGNVKLHKPFWKTVWLFLVMPFALTYHSATSSLSV